MNSILTTIKKMLGIGAEDASFDVDLIVHINSAFAILTQLGVGPKTGFSISDATSLWSSFLGTATDLESVKTYVYLKVKMIFDPPTSAAAIESMNRAIDELEWRIHITADSPTTNVS